MIWLEGEAYDKACAHAVAEYPRESCGLLINRGGLVDYIACHNAATTPSQHFTIPPLAWEQAEEMGEVVGVVHSHPDGPPRPSEGDRASCEATQLHWHLLMVEKAEDGPPAVTEVYSWGPEGWEAPLIGRQFHFGVLDCWALARDFYRREMGIELADVDHGPDGWWQVTDPAYTFSPYEDSANYDKAGLVRLDLGTPLQRGDLIVMQIRSRSMKPNHVAIILDPDRGTMLHHLYGALSDRTIYGGYWLEATRFILRHRSQCPTSSAPSDLVAS